MQRLGEYLRHRSALGLLLSELAILLVARHGSQLAEWAIHAPLAPREGVALATVQAIGAAAGNPPAASKTCSKSGIADATRARRLHATGGVETVDAGTT